MKNKYKIKISYSKYAHQYRCDLLELWFTIKLFGRSIPIYTGVFTRHGSIFMIAKSINYWMANLNIPAEMVFDSTEREFVS